MIYIVVPTYNRVKTCNDFVNNLYSQTYQDYHLILVDHGKTKTKITGEKITTIESDVNGWAKAVNIGLRYILKLKELSDDDLVLMINDDVTIPKDYFERIIQSHLEKPDAILGTCCIDKNTNKTLRVAIKLNRKKAKHVYLYQKINVDEIKDNYIESDVLTGKGTIIPVSVLKKIGLYNEERLPHYKADHELIWRAKKMGYPVYTSKKMRLYTLSDQKTANGKEPFLKTVKFLYFDMRSTINIRDCYRYAMLAYKWPYSWYFFILNFLRNTIGMLIDYFRTK